MPPSFNPDHQTPCAGSFVIQSRVKCRPLSVLIQASTCFASTTQQRITDAGVCRRDRTDAGVCHICAPTVAAVWLILLCFFVEFGRLLFAVCRELGTMCGALVSLSVYNITVRLIEYSNDTYEFFDEFYRYTGTICHG